MSTTQHFAFYAFFSHRSQISSDKITRSRSQISVRKCSGKFLHNGLDFIFLVLRPPWVVLGKTKLLKLSKAIPQGKKKN